LRLLRKPSLTWPELTYLANRVTCVAGVVSTLVGLNVPSQINCQAWASTTFAFPLLELEFSLLLIFIRVIAIWERSKLITFLTAIVLSMHWGVTLHLLSGIRAFWNPGVGYTGCVLHTPQMYLVSMSIATIGTYAVLFIAMLVGLLRHRPERSFGIWKMLSLQGWMWLALAVVAEVPTLVIVLLNKSYALNFVLQVPRVVIASIGTTMMFQVLHKYPGRQEVRSISGGLKCDGSSSMQSASLSSPCNPVKISVHTFTVSSGEDTLPVHEKDGV